MRYILLLFLSLSINPVHAQDENIRDTWRSSTKIKLDLFNLNGEFPSFLLGLEYPLKNSLFAIEHELGPIFNSGLAQREIEKSTGWKTSHTLLMYSDRNDWILGLGVHYRLLNLEGNFTTCAGGSDGITTGGCSYFRLIDDPVKIQRLAGYARLRRLTYLRRRITFGFGLDYGIYTQSISNPEFEDENLSFRTQSFRQNLNRKSGMYFRLHAQFIYRL